MHRLTGKEIVRAIKLLRLIDQGHRMTIVSIADHLGTSPSTISNLVRKLHHIGVVESEWNKREMKRGENASRYLNQWTGMTGA